MRADRKPVLALVVWTFIVWLSRIRNIVADDTLSGFDFAWSLGVAVTFCALAAAGLAARGDSESPVPGRLLAFVSIGYWMIRGVQIGLADHSAGFIAVHTVLSVVSITLGVWVLARQRPTPT
jgi:hypothetical protein